MRTRCHLCLLIGLLTGMMAVAPLVGCGSLGWGEPEAEPIEPAVLTAGSRPLWRIPETAEPRSGTATQPAATQPAATQPGVAHAAAPTTQPAAESDVLAQPYRLNVESIILLTFHKSRLVASSRESMIAAQHGLEEFKANLSRLEPFVRASGDMTDFPKRRHSEGIAGEATGGIEKETFDGARFRVEGGIRGERVEFGDVGENQERVEEGSGGVVRGRVEFPFAGSRIRQDRVISAAFQESTARKAVLNYLSNYRSYADSALTYYDAALYYLDYAKAYQHKLDELQALADDPRVNPTDLSRIESVAGDTRVLIEQYQSSYRTYLLSLLQYLGIQPDEEFVLQERSAADRSRYYELALTEEGRREMLDEAFENNPKFRVLADAIADAKLKRDQAIAGKYDITAFSEGTQFAFGSETFDDRVGGWMVGGGVTFRVNDPRVLTASRRKAEAEIRQFEAEIEAERLRVQREVAVESTTLAAYHASRPQIYDNIAQSQTEYDDRRRAYFEGGPPIFTIDDVLTALSAVINGEIRLANNLYYSRLSEDDLITATGEVYRQVGMEIVDNGNGVELTVDR